MERRSIICMVMENIHEPDAMLKLMLSNEDIKKEDRDENISGYIRGWGACEGSFFAAGSHIELKLTKGDSALDFSGDIVGWTSEPENAHGALYNEEYTLVPDMATHPESRIKVQMARTATDGFVRIDY